MAFRQRDSLLAKYNVEYNSLIVTGVTCKRGMDLFCDKEVRV
jgi:hypothetical protein